VPLVFHDRDATRMCGVPRVCSETPAKQFRALELLGSGEKVPLLTELLELVGGRAPLLLELKSEANGARFAAQVLPLLAGYCGAVGVMSFDPGVGGWLAKNAPRVRRGLVLSRRDILVARWRKLMKARPEFLAVRYSAIHRPWVARARRRMPVYCWTIRSPAEHAQARVHADALIWEADGRP